MPGLRFTTGLDVGALPQTRYGNTQAPASATEAAFGPANAPSSPAVGLMPTHPGGLAFWVGVAGVALLVFVYRSLPG